MANTKISALPAVVTPSLTDEIPVNQGGTTKKLTISQITGGIIYKTVSNISSAQILANADINIIAAPGANFMILPISGFFEYIYNSIAYTDAVNVSLLLRYTGTTISAFAQDLKTAIRNQTSNNISTLVPQTNAVTAPASIVNLGIDLRFGTAYAAGNGTARVTIYYMYVPTTV